MLAIVPDQFCALQRTYELHLDWVVVKKVSWCWRTEDVEKLALCASGSDASARRARAAA